jgi:deoxyribodipyrimidine photo-lyase
MGNPESIRSFVPFASLFNVTIPNAVPGFELEDAAQMEEIWPAGTDVAREVLHRFLTTKYRTTQIDVSPISKGAQTVSKDQSRLGRYHEDRDKADRDSSSRLSPYLSAGVISARELVRETMKFLGVKKVDVSRENGDGVWVQEIGRYSFHSTQHSQY